MSVFLLAEVGVIDDSWLPDYAANVHHIVAKHGGRYLTRSGNIEVLEGEGAEANVIAIIEFPDRDKAMAFVNDPAYAPFGEARRAGTNSYFRLMDQSDAAGSIPYLMGE